jgi:xanthine dehydrogenase accessory factor
MQRSSDSEVIHQAAAWLEAGDAVTLVTVVQTWGSAPRRPGAMMVIHADGRFTGSVSGGCVEDDLVQRVLRGEFGQQPPRLIEYGINTAMTRSVGLPCGGRLQLVVEYLVSAAPLRAVVDSIGRQQRILRRVCLNTGEASLHSADGEAGFTFDGDSLYKVFGPGWRMLIIGAGELSQRVARLALTLDYAVTICDSRAEYADGWQVEGAAFSTERPDAFIERTAPDAHTVVLALAHAPALEDAALAAALKSDAFYIGALGSRRNQRARLGRLQRLGLDASQLDRLHGPVGLDIGSHTPAEIAIAITAGLIEARNHLAQHLSEHTARHG